jgi:hypothetical protein
VLTRCARSAIGYCANDALSPGCPTYNAYSNGNCATGLAEARYGEVRGPMATCLRSTLASTAVLRHDSANSGCYNARCAPVPCSRALLAADRG